MESYQKLEKLGEGTFGKVYKGVDKNTGQVIALKKVKVDGYDTHGIHPTTLREISILKMFKGNRYIVTLLDVVYADSKNGKPRMYLVFEYMDSDLHKYIKSYIQNSKKLHPQLIKNYIYQICKGVAQCHGCGIMHRDLKPDNLLMDLNRGWIKIGDLGLARGTSFGIAEYSQRVMTLWYRAPEVLLGDNKYNISVDMWSVGCIFAEMCRMKPLFISMDDKPMGQIIEIFRHLGTPDEHVWPGVTKLTGWHIYPDWKPKDLRLFVPDLEPSGLELLSKMLLYNPFKRISANRALNHPYFDDLDKSRF